MPRRSRRRRSVASVSREELRQLRLARVVQQALLPPPVAVPELDVAARFFPSRSVGGDFYDYFNLGPPYFALYIGDVQGKGLEAAMYALLVSGLMRGLHKTGVAPAEVLRQLNRRMCLRNVPGRFCCLSYALFDCASRRLQLANAGLPFPLLLRGASAESLCLPGPPVGLFDSCAFDQVEVALEPGDRVLFYTDGLDDSLRLSGDTRPRHEAYLARVLARTSEATAEGLADGLARRLQRRPRPLHDDAAYLVVRVTG